MTYRNCVVVSVQGDEAKLYCLDQAWARQMPVRPEFPDRHFLRRRASDADSLAAEDHRFYGQILGAIQAATMILLIGDPVDQDALVDHVRLRQPGLAGKLIRAGRRGATVPDGPRSSAGQAMPAAAGD